MPHTLGTPKSFWGDLKSGQNLQTDKKKGEKKIIRMWHQKNICKIPLKFFL